MTARVSAWVTQADPNLILRVVGFLEYASALRYLDELVKTATPEELAAIDELIQERPEFTIHINVAQPLVRRPTTLLPVGKEESNERNGLAWVMALARVELGAMLATFDAHPEPFKVVGPTKLEWEAYQDIMLDDAEAHFWSLANDPNVERLFEVAPGTEILAYIRRLNLAIHFLRAAAQSRVDKLTNAQANELLQQYEQLGEVRNMYLLKVKTTLALNNREHRAKLDECCRMLEGSIREMFNLPKKKERPAEPSTPE